MMAGGLSKEFKDSFQKLLDTTGQSPGIKLEACMAMLRANNIAYKLKAVQPALFLVHNSNRGGLGLSPYNVHQNASKIFAVGASTSNCNGH